MIGRLIAMVLIGAILSSVLGKWVLIIDLILLLLWIIRLVADLFWKGRNKELW